MLNETKSVMKWSKRKIQVLERLERVGIPATSPAGKAILKAEKAMNSAWNAHNIHGHSVGYMIEVTGTYDRLGDSLQPLNGLSSDGFVTPSQAEFLEEWKQYCKGLFAWDMNAGDCLA